MATMYPKKNRGGSHGWQIQFQTEPRKRKIKSITLPSKFSKTDAEEVRALVQKLADSIRYRTELDARTKAMIDQITPFIRKKLEGAGLLEPSKRITAFQLWDRFTDDPDGRKDSTILTYTAAQNRFFAFFDPGADPNEITIETAKAFRKWMNDQGYAEATITNTITRTRAVFTWGVKQGYVRKNVFLEVRRGSYENKDREHYVTPEDYLAILDACPSQEWRVFIALMRIGGLRFSEAVAMKWADNNWGTGQIKVDSPKTAHHAGHEWRLVPHFPELRKELEELDAMAEPDEVYILDSLHGESYQNLANKFRRIIFQAGLKPWERLFHNLRASRSNELFREFSIFDASYWMGQSAKIAQHHYINSNNPDLIKKATVFRTVPTSAPGANATTVTPTNPAILPPKRTKSADPL